MYYLMFQRVEVYKNFAECARFIQCNRIDSVSKDLVLIDEI
jgi:hypothetical protein